MDDGNVADGSEVRAADLQPSSLAEPLRRWATSQPHCKEEAPDRQIWAVLHRYFPTLEHPVVDNKND